MNDDSQKSVHESFKAYRKHQTKCAIMTVAGVWIGMGLIVFTAWLFVKG